jgi:hypothetical protein
MAGRCAIDNICPLFSVKIVVSTSYRRCRAEKWVTFRLLVATRKGLFVLQAGGKGGWTLGEPDFVGEPVSMVLPDPRDGSLYAALNLGHFGVKLHRRRGFCCSKAVRYDVRNDTND